MQQTGLEEELTRRSVTHSAWDLSASKDRERRGWHPVTYKVSDATPALINSIKEYIFFKSGQVCFLLFREVGVGISMLKGETKRSHHHLNIGLVGLYLTWPMKSISFTKMNSLFKATRTIIFRKSNKLNASNL